MKLIVLVLIGIAACLTGLSAQAPVPPPDEIRLIEPARAAVRPKIDGELSDEIWKAPSFRRDFTTYNPLYGEKLPFPTEVWAAYDDRNLYFAFRCFDPDPGKLKTSIVRRDQVFGDDWVGLALDAMGNKQASFDFFVNPNGIQGDILNSSVSGEDEANDFVWDSAARVTPEGYQVEMAIPLRSIRYKCGPETRMGIMFWRKISRLGLSGSWPDLKPGQGFNSLAAAVYHDLQRVLNLELLPSLTLGSNRDRVGPSDWTTASSFSDFGLGLKYGLTSSITADLTYNPDFSQVESDAFQVEVNRRYPVFYSEKRPFFMEGADVFSFFTAAYGYFRTPVYTRRIVDPAWGIKLTGTAGRTAFGVLAAGDEAPGLPWEDGANPYQGRSATNAVFRLKQSLGGDNYVGGLFTGRDFAGGFNRVAGLDWAYRLFKNHALSASFMTSSTRSPEAASPASGLDLNLMYNYNTKPLGIMAAYEEISRDFRVDSGFLMRTGIREGWFWIGPNFYPDPKKLPWLKRINPHLTYQYIHDMATGMNDDFLRLAASFSLSRQGNIQLSRVWRTEAWGGRRFKLVETSLQGRVQAANWIYLEASLMSGQGIDYTASPSYRGDVFESELSFVLQPSHNLDQAFSWTRTDFNRAGADVYEVDLFFSRTTYQFNKYFFIRAIVQYDSYRDKVLTDFLASFTFIPGTVMHVGYGGAYDKRVWDREAWLPGGSWMNYKRSFFFKASYLWRF